MKSFNNLSFEFVYPSKSFSDIYDIALNLKEKLSNTNVEIILRILEMDGFHDTISYSSEVKCVILGNLYFL